MQQRSLGQRIWRLFSPMAVKMCVAFIVEVMVLTLYMLPHMSEMTATLQNQEEYFQNVLNLEMELISKYGTQITAVAALATIPILTGMFLRDRRGEECRQKAPLWKYIMIIGISIPFALGANNILLLSNLAEVSEAFQEAAEVLYNPSLEVQIICLGVIIPIMEELIFRGLIYKRLCEESSAKRAMFYSALFFGLYHGNMIQMLYGFLSGLLFVYLYDKFNSIKAPMAAHMVMNIFVCIVTEMRGFNWIFEQPLRMGIITVACAAVASSMFVLIREKV